MSILSKTNKYSLYFFLSFFFTLLHTNLQAAECPTLTKKTLDLCNPTREEVAEGLGAPIAIIDGVRAVGSPDPSNETFFQTIKDQEYQFKWIFKDGAGNVVATGCPQTFELQDNEAPTCGAATLKVHGYGLYVSKKVVISEFENQIVTWKDNCTSTDEIKVTFDKSEITSTNYLTGNTISPKYIITDKFGNESVCKQTINISTGLSFECPAIQNVYIEVPQGNCEISCDNLKNAVYQKFPTTDLPLIDKFNGTIPPNKENNSKVQIYYATDLKSTSCSGTYKPGEYKVYFYYGEGAKKFCSVPVIVKENSTPPECPELPDIIITDESSATISSIQASIKTKVNSYSAKDLDNCTPNANLDVVYTGTNLTEGFCGNVSYSLSDFGSMRSCAAKVVMLKCPELPQLTKKFCNYNQDNMPKAELVQFLNENKPSLSYCSNSIEGTYNASDLSKSNYSNGNTVTVNWKFNINDATKTCPQQIRITRDNNLSCVGKDVTLNAESNCMASGAGVPLPTVTACDNSYSLKWFKRSENTYNNATRHSISELNGTSFQDNDVIIWALYYDESCRSNIIVVDNTKPTCTNPSLEKLTGKCSFTRSEVEAKMPTTDKLGTDNCGIKSAAIDWDQTAFETFTSNSDGSPKTYDIYYTITDNSDLTNDGFCIATIEVEGIPAPNCPDTEIYALSSDGTAQISLSKDAEWSIKSPSSVSFNAGKITGLSLDKTNNVEFEAKWCDSFKKVCPTTIKLIKAVKPCNE